MSQVTSLNAVLEAELKDLYSAENQLIKALPKMAKKASNKALREAIQSHLAETEGQIERLQKIGEVLRFKLSGKVCKAMQGLIEEAKDALEGDSDEPALIDTMLIAAAQRVEHYEMSGYGTAAAIARQLDLTEVVELLEETLEEEAGADKKLTALSEEEILPQAAAGVAEPDTEEVGKSSERLSSRTRSRTGKSEPRARV